MSTVSAPARPPILDNVSTLRKVIEVAGHPNYEAVLELQYRKFLHPGDSVVDIGAHSGRHTVVFADLVGPAGRVLAFEPIPEMYDTLRANVAGRPQVTSVRVALGNANGVADFVHAVGTPEESGLRARTAYNLPDRVDPHTIRVTVERLDDHLAEFTAVAFVKIDIEGGELDCLAGGEQFIRRFRPIVSVEYGSQGYSAYGHERDALYHYAVAHDYALVDLFGFEVPDATTWSFVCDSVYWDYFLIPRERAEVCDLLRR
jgi:FkbM family methyltransferase